MAILMYSTITSLDGHSEDEAGNVDWAVPDEAVHRFVNELERSVGTYLYGRRMQETMAGWETDRSLAVQAFGARLVHECHLFVAPVVVGGGKRALPDDVRFGLDLLDERRFGNGTVYLRYRTGSPDS